MLLTLKVVKNEPKIIILLTFAKHESDTLGRSEPMNVCDMMIPIESTSTKQIDKVESNGYLLLNFFNVPKTSIVLHWAQMFRA